MAAVRWSESVSLTEWLTPSSVVGLWSAIAGTLSAAIAWRVYRWQQSGDAPIVTADFENMRNAEWLVLLVRVRNFSSTRWRVQSAEVRKPKFAKAVSQRLAYATVAPGQMAFEPETALRQLNRHVELGDNLEASGSSGVVHQQSDRTMVRLYFLRKEAVPKVAVRLTLISKDGVERRVKVDIKREVPEPPVA